MAKPGSAAASSENTDSTDWEKSAVGNYNTDINNYSSNVNAALAEGNPYESKAYKTEQNLVTSGAMHSQNDAAEQQMRGAALRTGQNAAAINPTVSANARAGQQELDKYNAGRDTENQDKYLQYKQTLMGDQLGAAQSEAGMASTMAGQRNASTNNLVDLQNENEQMWTKLGTTAMQSAGAGLTSAYA